MPVAARLLLLSLSVVISLSVSAQNSETHIQGQRIPTMQLMEDFRVAFSEARLEKLLMLFTEKVRGVGFRYFADANDFDHGHILFAADLKPVAILYHTQEQAYDFHIKDPGGKYDYLNTQNRNWIQWLSSDPSLDGTVIENASGYMMDGQEMNDRFTIFADQLDGQKVGADLVEAMQFRFKNLDCETELPRWFGVLGKLKIDESCYKVTIDFPMRIRQLGI